MSDLKFTDEDINITDFDVDKGMDFLPTFDELSEAYEKLFGKDTGLYGTEEEI